MLVGCCQFTVTVVTVILIVVRDEREVHAGEEAEDHRLDKASQELDGDEQLAEWQEADLVHRVDRLVTAVDVSEQSKTQRNVLHDFGNDFNHEDHRGDDHERPAQLRTGKVREVADHAVGLDAFVLDVSDGYKRHSKVEAKNRRWRSSDEQRNDVAEEDD